MCLHRTRWFTNYIQVHSAFIPENCVITELIISETTTLLSKGYALWLCISMPRVMFGMFGCRTKIEVKTEKNACTGFVMQVLSKNLGRGSEQ